jgi:hypothetical protein
MVPIERKIVHVGTDKIITLFYFRNKFTLNWKTLGFLFLSHKIKQLQKNGIKLLYVLYNSCLSFKCKCNAAVEYYALKGV